mgnify:CR=1 FL=1
MNLRSLPSVPIFQKGALPGISAVYFLTDSDYTPLYIGEASCLKYRWSGHPKKQRAAKMGADRIIWVKIRPERRIKIERWLIQMYQPPINTMGTPRDRRLSAYRRGPQPKPPTP